MALQSRDVAYYAEQSKIVGMVEGFTINRYFATVVAAVLVYDAGKQSSAAPSQSPTSPLIVCTLDREVGSSQSSIRDV